MAVTTVMTGTNQTMTVVAGSPNVTFTSGVAANWLVGATVQGMSWPAGTKIVSITGTPATATAAVLSVNYPSTSGSGTVIVSSNNATITLALTASGDTASPQTLITAGFGSLDDPKSIQIYGRTYIQLQISNGATYDDTDWVYMLGLYSYIQAHEGYTGTWRSGWVLNGSTYIKAKGATVRYQQARAAAGGTSVLTNSGIPAGFPTNKLKLHWNDMAWLSLNGTNFAMFPGAQYAEWYQCGDIIFDYYGDNGANGSFTGSYGSIEKLSMLRVIGGISTGYDATQITSIGKIEWFCIPNGDTTGSNPDIKLGTANNVPVSGFAPIFYQTNTSLTFIGVNTTNTEIIDDYILPTNYPLITNSRNYANGNRTYRRTVSFTLNDSNASALTNVTVYVKSGATTLVNAVQTGNFSQKLNTVFVNWAGRSPASGSYIAPITSLDTRSQTVQIRKYGYQQSSVSYDLTNASYSQPFFMLTESALSGISEATATAITTAGINWTTKTITPTSNLSYDQINARLAYELALTTGSTNTDPRTITGSNLVLATGWTLVVNTGITILAGTNITYLYVPTITLSGTGQITGLFSNTLGLSARLNFSNLTNSSIYVSNNLGAQYDYQGNLTGTYTDYFNPPKIGTYNYITERYGYTRKTGSFTPSTGGDFSFAPIWSQDLYITQATQATVAAYTTLDTLDKLYDYEAYWRTTNAGIPNTILSRNGTLLDFGTLNIVVDASAASVWNYNAGTSTLTIKATTLASGVKFDSIKANNFTTNNGSKITAVYTNIVGTSTVLQINTLSAGYSICLYQGGTTKYFTSGAASGSYYVYLSPSENGTYTLAAENYGQKRTQDTLVLSGGNVWYNITDTEDVGITATKSVANAYTTLTTTEQIYDATAIFRLSETGIKLGQLVARDGLYLDFGTFNVKLKDDAVSIVGVASGTITYKSLIIDSATKYNAMKATPPATITPTDTEQINVVIEDANGNSQLSILGGDNLGYKLYKVPSTAAVDVDPTTGVLLTTLATNADVYRFIGISGYDIIGVDLSSGVKRRTSMVKGVYSQSFYVGNQIQLATDAPQLIETNNKIDELILKVDTDLDIINKGVQLSSLIIPHTTNLP